MKLLLNALSSLGLALITFVGGLITATALFTAEPGHDLITDQSTLWTGRPVKVDVTEQKFERLPARPVSQKAFASETRVASGIKGLEPASGQPQEEDQAVTAHLQWCTEKYRSYRPDDNSYLSYSGRLRACVSPFMAQNVASNPMSGTGGAEVQAIQTSTISGDFVSAEVVYPAAGHVDYCFARYRSYRPEDNSYQPFDGGPRRQCRQ
ncbi:BA14K family protein [Aminobacter carboxidus]|uniref:Lectin-like protein BA14k n=1 Tax=Aminobacter carboxidus TaxID=376165 RepID=A0A8E2BDJ8_9HYPH|nr:MULTISPECIES: BA14K family protein [Aminobacter carboxidus group]MBB6468756.1 hypothetical protein [Aminobacter lissarensis]MBE1206261.1 BA14K family protein [Aminobacter carboxidus]